MAVKVYFLAPRGTFTEQAVLLYQRQANLDAEPSPASSNASVVRAVNESEQDYGVVPIENSLEGPVNETMDAMLTAQNVYICGELALPIEHNLIAAPGTLLEDIAVVKSHPQALGQCRAFLETKLPGARLEAALSTAGAVEEAVRTPGMAALGHQLAAQLHGGEVLAAAVQDVASNKTRFLVIARRDAAPTGDDKTSIAFTVADRPGSLVSIMNELSDRGLNLTRIESRPSREELGKYVFLIDFQGHRSDRTCSEALAAILSKGATLLPAGRPMGSYPRFVAPFLDGGARV
jgi:prephenate dehydratase